MFGTMLLAVIVSACTSSQAVRTDEHGQQPSFQRLEAIYQARMDSARSRYSQADVDFMTGMISHHAQALVMAQHAVPNGAGNQVQLLAARIINAQKDEIATMQQWLRDRDKPVPEVHIMGNELMIHGVESHHMVMPGMLTQEQLDELAAAHGSDFDRLFLSYMVQHHRGAVSMVEKLFSTDGAALEDIAFKLASDIQVDQRTEIERMERMIADLPR